jgi:predicted dehydrogenase/threonine dehydrogenase-like Zn-dependent dehydrogenase
MTVAEVPTPQLPPGSLLIRVAASVVSAGTERTAVAFAQKSLAEKARSRPDLLRLVVDKARREGILTAYESAMEKLDQSQSLGYSAAGTVLAVGDGVEEFRPGDRVACAGGNYAVHAEVVCVPKNLVARIPDGVIFEDAAFTTLGAVAVHGLRLAQLQFGETVAVIGLGLVGQVASQLARAAGCSVLGMDPNPDRCELAKQLGCDATAASTEEFRRLCQARTNGIGADSVIITAASQENAPVVLAGEVARSRAHVVAVGAVGLDLPRKLFFEKELSFCVSRSYGPGRYDRQYEEKGIDYPIDHVRWTEQRNMESFLELVARGSIDVQKLITHRFEISEAERAYDLASAKSSEPSLAIVLRYGEEPQISRTMILRRAAPVAAAGMIALGVMGAGSFGKSILIPAFKAAGASLEGLCTATGITGHHAGSKFGFRYCTTDPEELLRDPRINAIAIATPHDQHASQVLAALAAGKHVFCEKPLCLTGEELERIGEFYQAMRDPRPLLTVGYNRRFAPMMRQMREFFTAANEPLLLTYRVNGGFIPRDTWVQDPEIGGGRILGELCHFIDAVHYLTGSLTDRVSAKSLPNSGRYSDDNLIVTLELGGGSVATIVYAANGDKAMGKERIEIFGAGKSAVLDDFRKLELVADGRRRVSRSLLRQNKGHRAEYDEFLKVALQGGTAPIPFQEIVACAATTMAIAEAVSTGSAVKVKNVAVRFE